MDIDSMNEGETELYTSRPSLWLTVAAWGSSFLSAVMMYHFIFQLVITVESYVPALDGFVQIWWLWVAIFSPFAGALAYSLKIYCTRYIITDQRLIIRRGVLSTSYDELELSRIRDFRIEEPFSLRIMGLGNLIVFSVDRNMPQTTLRAQKHIQALRNELRDAMLERQQNRGYREYEVT